MIKNDYITTNAQRTQKYLDKMPKGDYESKKRENLRRHKQLNEVISGKQRNIPLSNPMRFLAQKFANDIANDSTASPEKRRLLFTHLSKYVNQIPLYLSRQQISTSSQTEEGRKKRPTTKVESTIIPTTQRRKSSTIELRKKIKEKKSY